MIYDGAVIQYLTDPKAADHRTMFFMMLDALLIKAGVLNFLPPAYKKALILRHTAASSAGSGKDGAEAFQKEPPWTGGGQL